MPHEAADEVGDITDEDYGGHETLEQLGPRGEVLEGQVAVVRVALDGNSIMQTRDFECRSIGKFTA